MISNDFRAVPDFNQSLKGGRKRLAMLLVYGRVAAGNIACCSTRIPLLKLAGHNILKPGAPPMATQIHPSLEFKPDHSVLIRKKNCLMSCRVRATTKHPARHSRAAIAAASTKTQTVRRGAQTVSAELDLSPQPTPSAPDASHREVLQHGCPRMQQASRQWPPAQRPLPHSPQRAQPNDARRSAAHHPRALPLPLPQCGSP